jgi:hypothetical protein
MVNHKLTREIHTMHDIGARLTRVVKKLPLKNKYNPSSIGTNRPPNH